LKKTDKLKNGGVNINLEGNCEWEDGFGADFKTGSQLNYLNLTGNGRLRFSIIRTDIFQHSNEKILMEKFFLINIYIFLMFLISI